MISIANVLNATYVSLIALKLLQWAIHTLNRRIGKNEDMYTPSFNVILITAQYFLFGGLEEARKMPRKDLRKITDPWIEDYTKYLAHGKREKKTFQSIDDAMCDFFLEFCQETNAIFVPYIKYTSNRYLRCPLGFCAIISVLGFAVGTPILILREMIFFGGGPYSVACKVSLDCSCQIEQQRANSFFRA